MSNERESAAGQALKIFPIRHRNNRSTAVSELSVPRSKSTQSQFAVPAGYKEKDPRKTKMNVKAILLAAAVTLAPIAMTAQTTPTPGKHDHNIHQRQINQRKRIANGVKSGQLTRREARTLKRQHRAINREARAMRAQNNGRLTRQDRKTIHRQQNQESRRIYRKKHNARVRK
jgi:hypothetical protein